MTRKTLAGRVLALLVALMLIAAACGSDSDSGDESGSDGTSGGDDAAAETQAGGDFIDLGTFVGDPPEHLDPALNTTLDAYQVINAVYDGLTDIDTSDPANPVIVPDVAESYEANDDATVWTFTIRDDQVFSNGEQITPSTFKASWDRAAQMAGDYSYLMSFIEGGIEVVEGDAEEISGVVANDDDMTLEVTLTEPYSNFDAVAGFQLFFPLPSEATDAADFTEWENGIMIGNGPFAMTEPRTDEEILLEKNDEWDGDYNGETWPDRLDTIKFVTTADPDTAYNSFEAGEGNDANIPPARTAEAQENYGTTLDVPILGSYHFQFNLEDPSVGGDDNLLFRQAVDQAIDRDEINEAVYSGSRTTSTGITPEGIPGFQADLCEFCTYDPEAAQAAFEEWEAAGNSQDGPLTIQFNRDAGHEPVVQIMVDNLAAIGIDAEADPMDSETYFSELADGACVFCRTGWFADYPTYDNFMYDLFHSDALGGNNYGFSNEEFDSLVDEAKQTTDKDEQADLFVQAEEILVNEEIGVVPINWYRGDYAYSDDIAVFPQTNFGLIVWEQVAFAA
ncbi:MAG: ABC transporter substrate-binding protein [Microthrixaceae bacterium]|nr:ABC transporter substrate-binding protein [Microthrixaceae bacterium]